MSCKTSDDLPVTPEGHILLLLETTPNKRTFSDYHNMFLCLQTMVTMYEEYREASNQPASTGDLKEFYEWIDSMHRVECFQYTEAINRYKRIPRENLKQLFGEQEGEKIITNEPTNAEPEKRPDSVEDNVDEDQLDYDDDDEGWDR